MLFVVKHCDFWPSTILLKAVPYRALWRNKMGSLVSKERLVSPTFILGYFFLFDNKTSFILTIRTNINLKLHKWMLLLWPLLQMKSRNFTQLDTAVNQLMMIFYGSKKKKKIRFEMQDHFKFMLCLCLFLKISCKNIYFLEIKYLPDIFCIHTTHFWGF